MENNQIENDRYSYGYPYQGYAPYGYPQQYYQAPQYTQYQYPYGQQYPYQYQQMQQNQDGVSELLPYIFTHHREMELTSQQLNAALTKAINGEHNAIVCYEQLAQIAPNDQIKNKILEIRKDEIRHYNAFLNFYQDIFGQQPNVSQVNNCPNQYRAGVESAFIDEQVTVDEYLSVADRISQYPDLKATFERAAKDEQNHAVWFLYFLNQ